MIAWILSGSGWRPPFVMLNLQDFDFEVLYRNGSKHIDADALSRLFRFDTLEAEDLLDKTTTCGTMSYGLALTMLRKIYLNTKVLDPGRAPDHPTSTPSKPAAAPDNTEAEPATLTCHLCATTDPPLQILTTPTIPPAPHVFDTLEPIHTTANPILTEYFTTKNKQGPLDVPEYQL